MKYFNKFVKNGFGSEFLTNLISCLKNLGAEIIEYSFLEGNIASKKIGRKI